MPHYLLPNKVVVFSRDNYGISRYSFRLGNMVIRKESTMSKTAINDLQSIISKLQNERQAHVDAITDIDKAFTALGIKPTKMRRRRLVAKKAATRARVGKKRIARKGPKSFRMTASDLVKAVIKKGGANGVTGTQITKAWRSAGRAGDPYNTLGELSRTKKIKRRPIKGKKRGSLYCMA